MEDELALKRLKTSYDDRESDWKWPGEQAGVSYSL